MSSSQRGHALRRLSLVVAAGAAVVAGAVMSGAVGVAADTKNVPAQRVVVPVVNAEQGKKLFISKGCVVCHSVNGVGGLGGPPLDSPDDVQPVDIADFAARMWRGSRAMAEWQDRELGYQIALSGDEIGHLAAFVGNRRAQATLGLDDIPEIIRDWIVEEPLETWPSEEELKM